jgi:hypothetical protein
MNRHSIAARVALFVLALVGFAGPATAGKQVPFKGSLEGVVTRSPLDPPYVAVLVEATGTATHLGYFALDAPHVVNTATRVAMGSYEFTAANGDTVYADFTGYATATAIPGVLYILETATITGGTGRFAQANGSFIAERWYDTITQTTTGSFEGTVSSPGS